MTAKDITNIRLHSWKKLLHEKEATPVILLSVVIKGKNTSQIVVQTTEDRTNEEVVLFLREALRQLEPNSKFN